VKAEGAFKKAVEVQPDAEEAVTSLAYLYNEEGDSKRALAVLEAVPEADRSPKIYSALGYTQEQLKNYKEAVTAYQTANGLLNLVRLPIGAGKHFRTFGVHNGFEWTSNG
jgi:tetratricopeptide (TPR) repeat protein